MTAQEQWKANVDGQKALDAFLKAYGDELLAALREKNLPVTSLAIGEAATYENSRAMEQWQGKQEILNALSLMGFNSLNGGNGKMPAVNRLQPMPNAA